MSPTEKKLLLERREKVSTRRKEKDARGLVRSVTRFIVPEPECNELREKETESHTKLRRGYRTCYSWNG